MAGGDLVEDRVEVVEQEEPEPVAEPEPVEVEEEDPEPDDAPPYFVSMCGDREDDGGKALERRYRLNPKKLPVVEHLALFWEETNHKIPRPIDPGRAKQLETVFTEYCGSDLAQWESFCHSVAMANLWKTFGVAQPRTLSWCLKPRNLRDILDGRYRGQPVKPEGYWTAMAEQEQLVTPMVDVTPRAEGQPH